METFYWNNFTRVLFPMANIELRNNGTVRLRIIARVSSAMSQLPPNNKGPNFREQPQPNICIQTKTPEDKEIPYFFTWEIFYSA